ncbi:hypothetical protein H6P81_008285 [Aristolochia fimbriata]|uniref:Uncharacterized protein n=1 Tax=Aristolochia fimbriata TaxID=158543 RepID=A0AAV7F5H0_ARIFI|nr:hypothetical protein H6P81_008285 [Aristolochia fimbriata]
MFLPTTATFVRFFSKKRSPNLRLRKINPKVPPQEAMGIAKGLYGIIKDNGPITVSNTWNIAKDAGIDGLSSKNHMKIMLKWMRGRKLLKLFCTHVGSNKKFFHSVLPEEPPSAKSDLSSVPTIETAKASGR